MGKGAAFWLCMFLLIAQCSQSGFVEQLACMVFSAALVYERASVAAALASDRGTELASTTSSAALTFTTSSLDLLRTAWIGVDLLDLRCTSTVGSVMGASGHVLAMWINSSQGRAASWANRSEVLTFWSSVVTSVGVALPYAASDATNLEVEGLSWSAAASAYVLANGYLMFEYRYVEVSFVAQWANPFWQALDLPIEAQFVQIQELIRNFTASASPGLRQPEAPATVDLSWMDPSMKVSLHIEVWFRAVGMHLRAWMRRCATKGGVGLMVFFLWVILRCRQSFSRWTVPWERLQFSRPSSAEGGEMS